MSRKLAINQHQVTALCKGAVKGGCIVEIDFGNNTVVRLVPKQLAKSRREPDPSYDDDIRL